MSVTIINPESIGIELPVLNSHLQRIHVDFSSPPLDLSLQQPMQTDNNSTSRVCETSNRIDPPIPAYTPCSTPRAVTTQPGTSARSSPPQDLSLQQRLRFDNSSTLRDSGTSNRIDPPIPAYIPSSPSRAITNQPGAPARLLHVDDELLRYSLAHDRGGIPVARLPESFPWEDGQSTQSLDTLPPYGANEPPRYTRRFDEIEPQTLAMLLFKFGFFCPPFWVFGALMLITPFRSPDPFSPLSLSSAWPPNAELTTWCSENIRTEEDKIAFLEKMHEVEMKWAKRCLTALAMLVCLFVAVGATILGILKVT